MHVSVSVLGAKQKRAQSRWAKSHVAHFARLVAPLAAAIVLVCRVGGQCAAMAADECKQYLYPYTSPKIAPSRGRSRFYRSSFLIHCSVHGESTVPAHTGP